MSQVMKVSESASCGESLDSIIEQRTKEALQEGPINFLTARGGGVSYG